MTKLNIGIILGSTREGRVSPQVGNWVKGIADKRGDANYEIVDIADYKLPFLGTTDGTEPGIAAWNEKLAGLDGFVFIVQEYNHSITGALKNALDFARDAWNNKAAGIVSYGSTGGARAAEHLRGRAAADRKARAGRAVDPGNVRWVVDVADAPAQHRLRPTEHQAVIQPTRG